MLTNSQKNDPLFIIVFEHFRTQNQNTLEIFNRFQFWFYDLKCFKCVNEVFI